MQVVSCQSQVVILIIYNSGSVMLKKLIAIFPSARSARKFNRSLLSLSVLTVLFACGDKQPDDASALQSERDDNSDKAGMISQNDLVRHPAAGEVIGFASPNGAFTWLGIPFAEPPVGELRWRAPKPMQPWDKSLLAGSFASPCVQRPVDMEGTGIDPTADYGSEDCLYLNIYAPPTLAKVVDKKASNNIVDLNLNKVVDAVADATSSIAAAVKGDNQTADIETDTGLPVMFWIHGGGNTIGEASQFDGSLLALQENVVLVSINYRLGLFGWFLQEDITGDGEAEADRSGNFGTLDMIRALEWTRDNIAAFGGNPNNITIFGESAGGRNVVSLLHSPLAKGLFHKAISQSGSSYFFEAEHAEFYHPNSGNAIVKKIMAEKALAKPAQLRDIDAHELLKGLGSSDSDTLPMVDVPNVHRDGYVLSLDTGLAGFRSDQYHHVPLMLGTNRDEQKLFMFLDPKYSKKVLGFWQKLRDAEAYNRDAYYMSVRWRIAGAEEPARAIGAPVYVYRFDWDEQATPLGMDFPNMIGAAHGLEMSFIFGRMDMGPFDQILLSEDNQPGREQLTKAMMAYWANFARSGNPNKGSNVPAQWQAWVGQEQYLILDTDTEEKTGIRMSQDTYSYQQLMDELKADDRFDSNEQRCGLYLELLAWSPELLAWKTELGC